MLNAEDQEPSRIERSTSLTSCLDETRAFESMLDWRCFPAWVSLLKTRLHGTASGRVSSSVALRLRRHQTTAPEGPA